MTQRGIPPEGFYTATTTKRMLGNISDGLLRTYIEKKLIERYVPPGRTQGFYKRDDVRRLAKSLDNFPTHESTFKERFSRATAADIPGAVQLLIEVFGGGDTTRKRSEWLHRNPDSAFVVKNGEQVVGAVFILPLTEERVNRVLSDPSSSTTRAITADDIQPYTPGVPVSLYIASLAAKSGNTSMVGKLARRARGSLLLRGMLAHFIELGKRGIEIKSIVGRSDLPDGINLLKKLQFTEIAPEGTNRNFIIDVDRSGIPFILQYKEALKEYQGQH